MATFHDKYKKLFYEDLQSDARYFSQQQSYQKALSQRIDGIYNHFDHKSIPDQILQKHEKDLLQVRQNQIQQNQNILARQTYIQDLKKVSHPSQFVNYFQDKGPSNKTRARTLGQQIGMDVKEEEEDNPYAQTAVYKYLNSQNDNEVERVKQDRLEFKEYQKDFGQFGQGQQDIDRRYQQVEQEVRQGQGQQRDEYSRWIQQERKKEDVEGQKRQEWEWRAKRERDADLQQLGQKQKQLRGNDQGYAGMGVASRMFLGGNSDQNQQNNQKFQGFYQDKIDKSRQNSYQNSRENSRDSLHKSPIKPTQVQQPFINEENYNINNIKAPQRSSLPQIPQQSFLKPQSSQHQNYNQNNINNEINDHINSSNGNNRRNTSARPSNTQEVQRNDDPVQRLNFKIPKQKMAVDQHYNDLKQRQKAYGGPNYDIFGNPRHQNAGVNSSYDQNEIGQRQRFNKLTVLGRNNEHLVLPSLPDHSSQRQKQKQRQGGLSASGIGIQNEQMKDLLTFPEKKNPRHLQKIQQPNVPHPSSKNKNNQHQSHQNSQIDPYTELLEQDKLQDHNNNKSDDNNPRSPSNKLNQYSQDHVAEDVQRRQPEPNKDGMKQRNLRLMEELKESKQGLKEHYLNSGLIDFVKEDVENRRYLQKYLGQLGQGRGQDQKRQQQFQKAVEERIVRGLDKERRRRLNGLLVREGVI